MITFTGAWRHAIINSNGTMTIAAHKPSAVSWTGSALAPADSIHVNADTLEFQPTGAHQVAALANLGYQLLQEIDAYRPGFLWIASPVEIVGALIEEASPQKDCLHYPSTMTPELADVLGLMNFKTGPIARVFREAGSAIKTKCEAEQAFVLDRFIRLAIMHGENWREVAGDDVQAAHDIAVAQKVGA